MTFALKFEFADTHAKESAILATIWQLEQDLSLEKDRIQELEMEAERHAKQ